MAPESSDTAEPAVTPVRVLSLWFALALSVVGVVVEWNRQHREK